ncbi:YicC family protein [Apibacter muscae]|uniref:YicC/YloC family endoribonuclease n=1 Tax=Apibacter muscae TaxID=2509004 RepID=UPI0011ABF39A|nr:YicC/YloC family endoribonuclease [Apibacter muscae]TWP24769.1 YicC family protein [Apibacter muscae]
MIKSMTGYGKSEVSEGNCKISTEIKTLNSKTLDLYVKIPTRYKCKELEIRKIIADHVFRGKVDFSMNIENADEDSNPKLNINTIKNYIKDLETLQMEVSQAEYLKMAVRMPEVFLNREELEISEDEWEQVVISIKTALLKLDDFRKEEGQSLNEILNIYILNILNSVKEIEKYEKERIEIVTQKLIKQLDEIKVQYDEQRFHQELVYYIEKLDISEEKVRLQQHCKYFMQMLNEKDPIGKKLGFIAQEMGREINTIGSKANHSIIQKLVVLMKDELEKIKEQTNNIL